VKEILKFTSSPDPFSQGRMGGKNNKISILSPSPSGEGFRVRWVLLRGILVPKNKTKIVKKYEIFRIP
jgi:hypothetical protein